MSEPKERKTARLRDSVCLESDIAQTKAALSQVFESISAVAGPPKDYQMFEFGWRSTMKPLVFIRCVYLMTKLVWLSANRVLMARSGQARRE